MSTQTTSLTDESGFTIDWLDDGAIFTICRPERLNALTKPILEGFAACLDRVEAQGKRLLVVTGRGERAFCAGTDLAEMQSMSMDAALDKSEMARNLLVRLSRSPVISVAAVNGFALGGGTELAMACTLRIAVPNAIFGLPEIKLGLLPAYAGTQFLPTLVGPARALELMLTGRNIPVGEAFAIGLVNRITDNGTDIVAAALAFAREITRFSPVAVAAVRACVAASRARVENSGLAVEDQFVREVFPGPDAANGIAAFLSRKKS